MTASVESRYHGAADQSSTAALAPYRRRRPSGEPEALPASLNRPSIVGIAAAVLAVVLVTLASNTTVRNAIWFPELRVMQWVEANRQSGATSVIRPVYEAAYDWAVPLLVWPPVAVLVITRRFRSAATFFAGFLLVVLAIALLDDLIRRPRPLGLEILGSWSGFSHPEPKIGAITAAVTSVALHSIPHGKLRQAVKSLSAVLVALLALSALYLGVAAPTALAASLAIGFAIPQVLFRSVTPPEIFRVELDRGNTAHLAITSQRLHTIKARIRAQLGLEVTEARPVGLDGSAGSTPLLLEVDSRSPVFAKLYAQSHLRSDRMYKVVRTLLYGRLEDEATFTSVRRLVQHEDYLAVKIENAGVRTAPSLGVVELAPEREYLAVFEFLEGAQELTDLIASRTISTQIMEDGFEMIDRLWEAGIAHRDIKPSNLMVTPDGRLALIDVGFGQIRPTWWRRHVDLGNMIQLLALGSPAQVVLEQARVRFDDRTIADSLAAAHGVAVPTQLRNALKQRPEVIEDLAELIERRPRIRIQRWSITRLLVAVAVGLTVSAFAILVAASAQLAGLLP